MNAKPEALEKANPMTALALQLAPASDGGAGTSGGATKKARQGFGGKKTATKGEKTKQLMTQSSGVQKQRTSRPKRTTAGEPAREWESGDDEYII